MSVALVMVSDGRHEYHHASLGSAIAHLPKFDHYISVEDPRHEFGFAGAVQRGFERVLETSASWVFWLELDFIFRSEVDVAGMIALLERQPDLAQVALKRQPVNEREMAAGGIVECCPNAYEERADADAIWTAHRVCFTTNPAVFSSRVCVEGWPQEPQSEGMFTHRLLEAPALHFAFWGGKFDPPLVEHIGRERAGVGY